MTIERWTLVSDGKRYHNLQRDMQGEYVEFNEYERDIVALKSLVINRLIDMGGSVPPDTPFNRLVDLLIMAVEKKTADRCNKFGMFRYCNKKVVWAFHWVTIEFVTEEMKDPKDQ